MGAVLAAWSVFGGLLAAQTRPEPKLTSVYPFSGQRGSALSTTVRGTAIKTATAVWAGGAPFNASIEGSDTEPAAGRKPATDLVRLKVRIAADAKPGRYPFRLVAPGGVSTPLWLYVTADPVAQEPEGVHDSPGAAIPAPSAPALFNGCIAKRGQADYYAIDASAGQTLTFQAISGLPSTGAPGGNAQGFDPSISIFEEAGSWFDPHRLRRIAFNDEPLWTIGAATDAHLVHTFAKPGRYLVRVEAFSGQGGPDYGYQLRILPGAQPPPPAEESEDWRERSFPRRLSSDRMDQLAARGAAKNKPGRSIETYRAAAEAVPVKLPATLEGAILNPGEAHRARFNVEKPEDIAIEIETPADAPPVFNPVVRLLNARNEEVATNLFAGRGACTGEMNKSLQPKLVVPLRDLGAYTVEIRDLTADGGGAGFRYRVLVRPQIPHIGQVNISDDRVNLAPGASKMVRVAFDREEDYRGAVIVSAEALPAGVQALSAADFEPDKDPPRYPGKRERYLPRTERAVVALTAAADAPASAAPQIARLVVRPVTDGKPGPPIAVKEIPMMVVAQ